MRPWLIRGSRGDNVLRFQELLYQAGLYRGRLDGWFGPKTQDAVKDWQREIGATVDGMVGPQTLDYSARLLASFNNDEALAAGKKAVVPNVARTFGGA